MAWRGVNEKPPSFHGAALGEGGGKKKNGRMNLVVSN